jgi:hypothetical protein
MGGGLKTPALPPQKHTRRSPAQPGPQRTERTPTLQSIADQLADLKALVDFHSDDYVDTRPQVDRDRDALTYVPNELAFQLASMAETAWVLAYEREIPEIVADSVLQSLRTAMGLWRWDNETMDWLLAVVTPETLAKGHKLMAERPQFPHLRQS